MRQDPGLKRQGAAGTVLEFDVKYTSRECRARSGKITTAHGSFKTPAFMPVGTLGTVKTLSPDDLNDVGTEVILANTYHLYLRPGHRIIESLGGLHTFMGWSGPILTDSGGFQVYSLADLRTISDEGVRFQSHLDGTSHFLRPEDAISIQKALGADIIMAFDECAPFPAEYAYVRDSVRLTSLWAKRCRASIGNEGPQAIFGIVQGGMYRDLRKMSASQLVDLGFDGYAIGGLSVGEDKETRLRVVQDTRKFLPDDKPVYLMGVGSPGDLIDAVMMGVDMFDCVLPTRNARNGTLFTSRGRLTIKNNRFAEDPRPIDESCGCYTCSRFSRAYLRHLFMSRELLAYRLNTIHNLWYYHGLMDGMRGAIERDGLEEFKRKFYSEQDLNE